MTRQRDRTRPYVDAARVPDTGTVRRVAWLRLLAVVTLAAWGSFAGSTGAEHDGLFLLIGLVWAPWACVVLLAADSPGRRLAVIGGPAGDALALVAVQGVAPGAGPAVLFGYLVVVAFTGLTAGRTLAGTLAAAFTLAAVLGASGDSADGLSARELAAFGAALLALLLLAQSSATGHALASARVEGLRTKADVILATVVGGVVVTDRVGRILQANPAAERILGTRDLTGRPCADALGLHAGAGPLDCRSGCALLHRDTPDTAQGQEVWRLTTTGDKQPLLASAVTLVTADGDEVVHSIQDITRLKQAEEAKTMFLATASHELKTPLTVINGFAETLSVYHDLDETTQGIALTAIRTRAMELTRVVDRLLLSSRIEAGRVSLVTGPVALPGLLRDRVGCLAQATDRVIRCEVSDDLQEVQGEAGALATVVDHLLDNALKYSPNGGEVQVSAHDDGPRSLISIRDQGIGMDAEQSEKCFDKFWQAESTDVRRFGGTGIGLYIVQSLVEAMGGRIRVESAPGEGTTFTIELRAASALPANREAGHGEQTSIKEFMRQIGVPTGGPR